MKPQSESPVTAFTVPLNNLTRADVRRAGAKAANLGELAHVGFPVPDGFAISTHAFDHFIRVNALDEIQSPENVAKAELPPEIGQALRAAAARLNGAPLAVRSSGVAEDLEGASFAGQYETILDVRGYGFYHEQNDITDVIPVLTVHIREVSRSSSSQQTLLLSLAPGQSQTSLTPQSPETEYPVCFLIYGFRRMIWKYWEAI